MSYSTRIYTEDTDRFGRKVLVSLKQKDYVGSATEVLADGVPYTITQGVRGASPFEIIKGTEISYSPRASTSGEYDFILDGSETDFILEVEVGDVGDPEIEKYQAFVYNDLYEESRNTFPQSVIIRAGDGLGRLSGKDYPIQNDTLTMAQVIDACLKESGHDFPVVVSDDLNDSGVTLGAEYGKVSLDDSVFVKRGLVISCRDVLEDVLGAKGVSMCQAWTSTGELVWFVHRRELLNAASISGDRYVNGVFADTVTMPGKVSHDTALTGVNTRKELAPRVLDRLYEHGVLSENLIRNSSFERITDGVADHWTFQLPGIGDVEVSDDEAYDGDFSLKLTQEGDGSFLGRAVAQAGAALSPKSGTLGGLRITFSVLGEEPGKDPGVRVLLNGQVWNFMTGTTEADTNQLSVEIIGINEWRTYTYTIASVPAGDIQVELLAAYPGLGQTTTSYFDDVVLTAFNLPTSVKPFQNAESTLSRVTRTGEDTAVVEESSVGLGDGPTPFSRRALRVGTEQTGDWDGNNLAIAVLLRHMAQIRTSNKILSGTFIHAGPIWKAVDYLSGVYIPTFVSITDPLRGYHEKELEEYGFDATGLSSERFAIVSEKGQREGGAISTGGSIQSVVESLDDLRGALTTDITASEGVTFTGSVVDGGQVKLTDGGVTEAKLASDSVSTAKIQNNAVTLDKALFADQDLKTTSDVSFQQIIPNEKLRLLRDHVVQATLERLDEIYNIGINDDGHIEISVDNFVGDAFFELDADAKINGDAEVTGSMTLGEQANDGTKAVRADRTLRMLSDADTVVEWTPSTAQNLTDDRTFRPTLKDATTTQRGLLSTTTQGIAGQKTFHNPVFLTNDSKLQSSAGFLSGFQGSGFQHDIVNNRWRLELDDMFIRGSLFAYEFIIQQISAINGSEILSAGVGKVESVTAATSSSYDVIVSDATGNDISPFLAGDIVLIQQVTPDAFSGGGQVVKRVVGTVDTVVNNAVSVITSGGTSGLDVSEGDVMVVIGSSFAARQSLIYRSVIEDNAPFTRVMTGVNSASAFANMSNVVVQYGNLDSLTATYSEVSGMGMFVNDRFYARIGTGDVMTLGKDAGGSGKHGIRLGDDDYLYGDKTFSLGGGIINGTATEARIARLEARSNRIYYQSRDATEAPISNAFAGLAASDQDGTPQYIRPSFFAGAASDGASDTRNAKIRLWPDGDAYFGGDVRISGQVRNATNSYILDDDDGVPAEIVNATSTNSATYDFEPLDGTPNPDETPPRHDQAADEKEVVRFTANMALSSSFSMTPEYRMVIQGYDGATWDTINHNNAFGLVTNGSGTTIRNFNVDNFTGYLQFLADSGTASMTFTIAGYYYGNTDYDSYRVIIQQAHGQTGGTSRVDSTRVRVYQRSARMNRNGFFIVDADVIKRAFTALDGDTLISTTNDFVA